MTAKVIPLPWRGSETKYLLRWVTHAEKMQMLYDCAVMRYEYSEALLAIAEKELARIKGV